jgi:membrane associated rhomboid family serine protease
MIPLRDDNPTTLPPIVTIGVILLCSLVFLWQQSQSPEAARIAVYAYGVVPTVLFGNDTLSPEIARIPPELSIVTSMFMHGGWMHIIGNMLYLWIFGNNIEDRLGHVRFVLFYLLCGAAAARNPSPIPIRKSDDRRQRRHRRRPRRVHGAVSARACARPRAARLSRRSAAAAMLVLGFWFVLQFLQAG